MELSVEEWDKILNTNLRAQFLCARKAAKLMKTKHRGSTREASSI
jgi:NAD(P)-dependent dehydrogenase (short-subunit alcohol dehydrogenase family)